MAVIDIVGRKNELKILGRVWCSSDPEFLAIYGRRRVGKTHLIRQFFSEKGGYLEVSGLKDKPMQVQLENFIKAVSVIFYDGTPLKVPSSWEGVDPTFVSPAAT